MGKVKQMVMEAEDSYWQKAQDIIGECANLLEFQTRMGLPIYSMQSDHHIEEQLLDMWDDYWRNYI